MTDLELTRRPDLIRMADVVRELQSIAVAPTEPVTRRSSRPAAAPSRCWRDSGISSYRT